MNKYQDKEASMDDYSHEKKLKADGRYEAAHGKMADAKNDFDHARALKNDAHDDAFHRHSRNKILKFKSQIPRPILQSPLQKQQQTSSNSINSRQRL